MVALSNLTDAYRNRVFNSIREEGDVAIVQGVAFGKVDQQRLLQLFGWHEHRSGFESCANKVASILKSLDKVYEKHTEVEVDRFISTVSFAIQEFASYKEYGRMYWRMQFVGKNGETFTLVQNMPDMPAQCTIYRNGSTLVDHKERTIGKALEYIFCVLAS